MPLVKALISAEQSAEPAADERPNIVLLHGWGSDSRAWRPLLEFVGSWANVWAADYLGRLAEVEESQLLDELLQELPPRFVLCGWSLGGMLAVRLAARAPERVTHLVTLAANLQFVAGDDWQRAMPADVFEAFLAGFRQAPQKTLKRFGGLMAKGDQKERQLLKPLRALGDEALESLTVESLSHGLEVLGSLDNRALLSRVSTPGLHLLGGADSLVPGAVVDDYLDRCAGAQQLEVFDHCGHAIHWSEPERVADAIKGFCLASSAPQIEIGDNQRLDKKRIAASFGKAASSYDSVAGLQRQIGDRLMGHVPRLDNRLLMDLGCGTGHFIEPLRERGAEVLGMDLAEGMLRYARQHHDANWLCADAEQLPLAEGGLDGVFSSLAIQWCHNLEALFGGLKRVVRDGGRLYLATLGPGTLRELRGAWGQVDGYVHVNRFLGESLLRPAIDKAGLKVVEWLHEDIVLEYDALKELTYELKTLGAHNVNAGQSSGLSGRARIRKLKEAYEGFRMANGKLPATYEVYYLILEA